MCEPAAAAASSSDSERYRLSITDGQETFDGLFSE